MRKRICSLFLAIALVVGLCPSMAFADTLASASPATSASTTYTHEFSLSSGSIVVDEGTSGAVTASGTKVSAEDGTYEISKNLKLTITAGGTYRITGTRADVAKGVAIEAADAVTIVLDGLTLSTTDEAPVKCKQGSNVTIDVENDVKLTDDESDTSNDGDPDGAAIKVAKSATAVITGSGTLTATGSYKNGIKGGASASIAIGATIDDSVKVNVAAAKNGIASDGTLVVNGGTTSIAASNDGVKSSPDPDDATSAGTITVNGGTLTVNAGDEGIVAEPGSETVDGVTTTNTTAASTVDVNGGVLNITSGGDGIRAEGDITIADGAFTVVAQHDGIQTNSNMSIANGTFDIKTSTGYSTSKYTGDTSCKGLKANYSSDEGNDSSKDTSSAANALNIDGGTFMLNTLDDAVHSDAYCTITGGTFTIDTGDDGVHADTALTLGTDGGYARDPEITINHSYEGLESGSIYAYSGKYYVIATDDGVNAAGGGSSGTDPFPGKQNGQTGPGNNDTFNPGGQSGQGRFGGQGGMGMRFMSDDDTMLATASVSTDTYKIAIYGGTFYVNCQGDGLDSNGGLYLYGGQQTVFSQAPSGDNVALDCDGALEVNGATVFTAGISSPMDQLSGSSFKQGWNTISSSISAGSVVNVTLNNTTVYSDTLPKTASYFLYSSPASASNSFGIAKGSSVVKSVTNAWNHTWTSTVTKAATTSETGIETYSCADLGTTELKTIPKLTSASATTPADSTDSGTNAGSDTGAGTDENTDSGTGASADENAGSDADSSAGESTGSDTDSDSGGDSSADENTGADTGATADPTPLSECTITAPAQVYTGKALTPVVVKYDGTTLKQNADYTVTYKNNKLAGKATATITGDGTSYAGTETKTFIIKPAQIANVKVKSKAIGKATVTWAKAQAVAANADGYQLRYKVASKVRYANVKSASTAKKILSSLAKGKKVTVKVRAYKSIDNVRYYGAWSNAASAKVKK